MPPAPGQPEGPLRSELAGDPDMAELVGLFVENLPTRLAALDKAVRDNSPTDLRRLTHQLRGSSASYGFPSIGHAAGRIEDALLNASTFQPDLSGLQHEIDALLTLCRRAAGPGGL